VAPAPRGGYNRCVTTRLVLYDASCGICERFARAVLRLDRARRLEFVPNDDPARWPAGVDAATVERTIVVIDPASGRYTTRARGIADILAALPLGPLLAWPLRLPGLATIAGRAYDVVSRHRRAISVRLGLAACGLPRRD
jgi:predicted DCC family thiol-disulfide oxidoreductase YuxK